MIGVHQVVAGAAPRDAITTHVLAWQTILRESGIQSEVFCDAEHLTPEIGAAIYPDTAWHQIAQPGDVAILHYSIDSPAFQRVINAGALPALHYHNVTPAELLWTFSPSLAAQCAQGRERLAELAAVTRWSASVSDFNAEELGALGFKNPETTGILRSSRATDLERSERRAAEPVRLLFVGRGVPNKAQHDCILAAAALKQSGIDVELHLIGSWGGSASYAQYCFGLARSVGIADQVAFHGSVNDEDLTRAYRTADFFLCLSDHEGYCVPLIEALESRLPVIALRAGAVPETLGRAGLLLDDKRPSMVAEAILAAASGEAVFDDAEREKQLAHHSRQATQDRLMHFIRRILDDLS